MASVKLGPKYREIVANKGWDSWTKANEQKLVRLAQQEAPIDTGNLRRNIRIEKRPGRKMALIADTEYASAVHDGHREIRPVNAKALRFVTKSGVVVYTKRVRATEPNRFLDRACAKVGLKVRR